LKDYLVQAANLNQRVPFYSKLVIASAEAKLRSEAISYYISLKTGSSVKVLEIASSLALLAMTFTSDPPSVPLYKRGRYVLSL